MTYEEAGKILPAVYETVRRRAAGMVTRPESWWSLVLWPMTRADKAHFVVVHEDARGNADAFAAYEITGEWSRGFSNRTLTVFDIQATNTAARAALWQYLLGVDLVVTVSADRLPIDEPLPLLLRDRVARGSPSSATTCGSLRSTHRAARGAAVLGVRRTSRHRGHRPRRPRQSDSRSKGTSRPRNAR